MHDNNCLSAATQIWFSVGKDIIISAAAIITSIVAIRGLNAWRKQLVGASKYDIAKKLKKSVYKVRHSIDAFRARIYSSLESEIDRGKDDAFERKIDKVIENSYNKRLQILNNSMMEFEDNQLDAEAAIGDEMASIGNKFRSLVRELEINLDLYLTMRSWEGFDRNDETFKSARAIVVASIDSEKDAYLQKVNSIVLEYKIILDKNIGIKH